MNHLKVVHLYYNNDYQSYLSHLKNKFNVYISNVEQIKFTIFKKFDIIFHSATPPRSSRLIDRFQDIETIYKGMVSVLELAKKNNAKVVLTSNSGSYGNSRICYNIYDRLYDENSRKVPGLF